MEGCATQILLGGRGDWDFVFHHITMFLKKLTSFLICLGQRLKFTDTCVKG